MSGVTRESGGVQSVARALELVDVIEDGGGVLSLTEMAARTSLPVGTIHRLLRALVAAGYLRQLPDRRYCLGSRLSALGASATALLGTRAEPVLRELARALGETANLAVLSSGAAEYIGQVAGRHAMRMFTEVGRRVPLYSTGVGKALLSQLSDREVMEVLDGEQMRAYTDTTITSVARMLDEIATIRRQGYAMDEGEMELGVRCMAVPVPSGVPMALSVSGPAVRIIGETVTLATTALQEAAEQLSRDLDDVSTAAPDAPGVQGDSAPVPTTERPGSSVTPPAGLAPSAPLLP